MSAARSRRAFLKGAVATAAVAAWTPAFRVAAAGAAAPAPPRGLPMGMDLYRQAFRNWTQDIVVDDVWTAAPRAAEDLVRAANWAVEHGWRLRARGSMHSWAPLTVVPGQDPSRVLLVDTTQHLRAVRVDAAARTVRAQPGVLLDDLLAEMQAHGLGFAATPAVGDITLGGALAIDGHGSVVPAVGERAVPGHTYGSLSNLVTSLTAVVWVPEHDRYELRRFERGAAGSSALLAHLGRALVTEVTLRVAPNQRLRCQSTVEVPVEEVLAAPGSGARRTLASYLDRHGRAEVIWFPFTAAPWLKVWSVAPRRPAASREVTAPYSYTFADAIPTQLSDLLGEVLRGNGAATPAFCQGVAAVTAAGLLATGTTDLWGWSKDVLLYTRPSTVRYAVNGYVVHCRRADVQRVAHDLYARYRALVEAAAARGEHPMNGPIEIRVTGLDRPGDCLVPGAEAPALSALRPRPDHPEWDTAVWFDAFTYPGTPGSLALYRAFERWVFDHFDGRWAQARVEWSKGYAYSAAGAQTDEGVLRRTIPSTFPSDPGRRNGWDATRRRLDALDPHRTFSNPFLDRLLP